MFSAFTISKWKKCRKVLQDSGFQAQPAHADNVHRFHIQRILLWKMLRFTYQMNCIIRTELAIPVMPRCKESNFFLSFSLYLQLILQKNIQV